MSFDLKLFLEKAQQAGASDIHIIYGKAPALRINGEIFKIAMNAITAEDIDDIINATLPEKYRSIISESKDLDYMYQLEGVSRYRINYCLEMGLPRLTMRIIPYKIKTLEELRLPLVIEEFTKYNNGIILVTGATGSGKSTTLASMIDIINATRQEHIVTLEDPVEFVYEDRKSIITQRSLKFDVPDFKTGLKYVLRQDPDVILIGEIRDVDTLLSAIEAAETGHLVFSTLHTNNTISSIQRLKGFLEESKQTGFDSRLADCIRGIIHQQLIPMKNKRKMIPANEILTFTPTVKDYVKNGKLREIYLLMQSSKSQNLLTMNQSLYNLCKMDLIDNEVAIQHSYEKQELSQMLRGVYRNSVETESLL